jgi:hypothetical protein
MDKNESEKQSESEGYRSTLSFFTLSCGERGIRTLGTLAGTHAFQACSIGLSDISPEQSLIE